MVHARKKHLESFLACQSSGKDFYIVCMMTWPGNAAHSLSSLMGSLPWQNYRAIRLREQRHFVFTNPSAMLSAFTAVQRGPAKVPLQPTYSADWWVTKSPYSSQGFAFSTFSVCLHEVWHWIGTAELVLRCLKRGQSLGPQSCPFLGGAALPDSCLLSSMVVLILPLLIPAELLASRYCHPGLSPSPVALPPGQSSSQLLHQLLPGGPVSSQGRSDTFD